MAHPPVTAISLFSGVGMLDEGLRAGLEYLGLDHRCIAYVEREAFACAQLVGLMEAGCLDPAPVWSDVATFPARRFRGLVDLIAGGFPCQDISIAGKRAGLDGHRSGLFFRILDIADDCDAPLLFLENVSAIATANATVVDEAEGELTERAASRIMGELADRGWDAEWLHVRASDVGAAHQRERWFCLAVRQGRGLGILRQPSWSGGLADRGGEELADAGCQRDERRGIAGIVAGEGGRAEIETREWQRCGDAAGDCIDELGNTTSIRFQRHSAQHATGQDEGWIQEPLPRSADVENAGHERMRRSTGCNEAAGRRPQPEIAGSSPFMAHPSRPRLQGREQPGTRIDHGGGGGSTWAN